PVLIREWARGGHVKKAPRMEPSTSEHGRNPRGLVPVDRIKRGEGGVAAVLLGVPLLDHAKPAELSFDRIEVTVVVGVARDKTTPTDPIDRLDPLQTVDRKRKSGDPRPAIAFVGKIETRRWDIPKVSLSTKVVPRAN